MGSERSIFLCGVSEADKAVFSSLLSIITLKTSERWVLSDGTTPDVVVVNVDSHKGQAFLRKVKSETKVITLAADSLPPSDQNLRLRRPLRARDILTCLEVVSKQAFVGDGWRLAEGQF